MPRKVTPQDAKEKTNMYLPSLLKAEFNMTLRKAGYSSGFQAAAIRTLMRLLISGSIPMDDQFKDILLQETYITPGGKKSKA